jgi:hypothetical protein
MKKKKKILMTSGRILRHTDPNRGDKAGRVSIVAEPQQQARLANA